MSAAPLLPGNATAAATFRWEEELRSSFKQHAHHSIWSRAEPDLPTTKVQESTCSDGRADLVWATLVGRLDPDVAADTIALLTQPTCSRILSLLKPRAARSEDYLLARSGVSERTFRYWLKSLSEADLAQELHDRRWVLGAYFDFPAVEICSFEFKLSKWRRALYQARRYRSFSHRVFVVMPPEKASVALQARDAFERFNVGLITHDSDGTTQVLVPSRKRTPTSRYRFIMALGMLWKAPRPKDAKESAPAP